MKRKHTPGPWSIRIETTSEDGESTAFVTQPELTRKYSGLSQDICRVSGWGPAYEMDGEQQANARLIAAAPELLEVAELVLSQYLSNALRADPPVVRQLRAAVRKAKG